MVSCSVCGQALSLSAPTDRPLTCWLCYEGNAVIEEEKAKRIANQRKKVEAENRKLDKRRTSEAGEGFRQKG